jgi:hypothetical protein
MGPLPGPVAPPDTASATLRVETLPSGLTVLLDGAEIGRAPLTLRVPAGKHRVAALPVDPREFSLATGERWVALATDATVEVTLDLRSPVILRSDPEPASVFLQTEVSAPADSPAGQTPLTLLPSKLEWRWVRFSHPAFADTTLPGDALVHAAGADGTVRVALRQIAPLSGVSVHARSKPVYRRSWFQWTLLGLGAALSASAIVFHNEADDWYQKYLDSSNSHEITNAYDQATHYDHLASLSLVSGQVLLVGGIYLLITNPSP